MMIELYQVKNQYFYISFIFKRVKLTRLHHVVRWNAEARHLMVRPGTATPAIEMSLERFSSNVNMFRDGVNKDRTITGCGLTSVVFWMDFSVIQKYIYCICVFMIIHGFEGKCVYWVIKTTVLSLLRHNWTEKLYLIKKSNDHVLPCDKSAKIQFKHIKRVHLKW